MDIFVQADRLETDTWRVEAIDTESEGECYLTKFIGLDAERRAKEYAQWLERKQAASVPTFPATVDIKLLGFLQCGSRIHGADPKAVITFLGEAPQTVYARLRRLSKAGLIQKIDMDGRHHYRLLPAGEAEIEEWNRITAGLKR